MSELIIEVIETINIDGTFFIRGESYPVIDVTMKEIKDECDKPKKYCGLIPHYKVFKNNRQYLIPGYAAAFIRGPRPVKEPNRQKYWIEKSQGDFVRDYVKLAYQMFGIHIGAKDGPSQADYANQHLLNQIYTRTNNELPGQPVKVIIPEYKSLESNKDGGTIEASIYLSIVSARMFRGDILVYDVGISLEPESEVIIDITTTTNLVVITPSTLVFNKEDYDKVKEVMVEIPESTVLDSDKVFQIRHRADWSGHQCHEQLISILLKADR